MIAALDVPVIQINTAGGCHLDANMVQSVLPELPLESIDLLVIENVGNLVCPAEFDLGEDAKVMLLSITEGDDKPLKYPRMFRDCEALLVNKVDLAPHLDVDLAKIRADALGLNPALPVFEVSARSGPGPGGLVRVAGETRWPSSGTPPPSCRRAEPAPAAEPGAALAPWGTGSVPRAVAGAHDDPRMRIEVTGVVQGVGFRPTVWRLARELGLAGFVRNSSAGVEIEVEGDRAGEFADGAPRCAPSPRPDRGLAAREVPSRGDATSSILPSREAGATHRPLPRHRDLRRLPARDSPTRRTGASGIPSSTAPTAGRATRSPCGCPTTARTRRWRRSRCARTAPASTRDPADRRFHAQPIACPTCGPAVTFRGGAAPGRLQGAAAIRAAIGAAARRRHPRPQGPRRLPPRLRRLDAAAVDACASASGAATRPLR